MTHSILTISLFTLPTVSFSVRTVFCGAKKNRNVVIVITKLGKKLGLRQRVIATATVFFRRFYLKNSYCETDPFIVISACCYVAAKAEESPVQIKSIIAESRSIFARRSFSLYRNG